MAKANAGNRSVEESSPLLRVFAGHTDHINGVALSANNQCALSSSIDNTVRLWNVETGEEIGRFDMKGFGVAISADGSRGLIGQGLGKIALLDLHKGTTLAETIVADAGLIYSIAFSADEEMAIFNDLRSDNLHIWNFKDGVTEQQIKWTKKLRSLTIAPDGETFLTGNMDKVVTLWDRRTYSVISSYKGAKRQVLAVKYRGDNVIAAHEMSQGNKCDQLNVIAWQRDSGTLLQKVTLSTGHRMNIASISLAADLSIVLTGSLDTTLRLNRLTFSM